MLRQSHLISLKFDGDFQSFCDEPRIMTLFVRNQTVKDFRVGAKPISGAVAREDPLRTGRHRGRIQSTAQKDCRLVRSQPVGDSAIEQFPELLDTLAGVFVVDGVSCR